MLDLIQHLKQCGLVINVRLYLNWKILKQVQDDGQGGYPNGTLKQVQGDNANVGLEIPDRVRNDDYESQDDENVENPNPF